MLKIPQLVERMGQLVQRLDRLDDRLSALPQTGYVIAAALCLVALALTINARK